MDSPPLIGQFSIRPIKEGLNYRLIWTTKKYTFW